MPPTSHVHNYMYEYRELSSELSEIGCCMLWSYVSLSLARAVGSIGMCGILICSGQDGRCEAFGSGED